MTSIELKNVRLHAKHGVYEGESKTGSSYQIDLTVKFDEVNVPIKTLQQTVNYVKLYDIVKQRMQTPVALLETFCDEVIHQVKSEFPFVTEILLSIYKLQPPIENFEGTVGVTLHKMFDD